MDPLERLVNTIDRNGCAAEEILAQLVSEHVPSVLRAGVAEAGSLFGRFGGIPVGECAYCRNGGPVIREYRDYVNGSVRKVPMHAHVDPHPDCAVCERGSGMESWPCAFLTRIAAHYGMELS